MNNEEMTKVVNDELTHISEIYDDLSQAGLRSMYNASRRHGLKIGKTKEETLSICIEMIKKDYPSWQPQYDKNFFMIKT